MSDGGHALECFGGWKMARIRHFQPIQKREMAASDFGALFNVDLLSIVVLDKKHEKEGIF